ncbi:MAG: prolyl oligopeptidase family serine peptidase [Pseudomonadota bacterium]
MRALMTLFVGVMLAGALPMFAQACGQETDCALGDRVYRIAMPEGGPGPVGALIFNHGYRGSHKGAMKNKNLVAFAHAQGMALVSTKSASQDWLIPGVPEDPSESGDKEFAYFDALAEALVSEHGIDRDLIVVTGFSAGGMMVWNLACQRGADFAGFVPIAGTFWDPVPKACPSGAVNLVHVHGTSDKIVPLLGRRIAQTKQGSIFDALEMLGQTGGYGDRIPLPGKGDLTCAGRDGPKGELLGFCTHPGGHSFSTGYLETALDLLRAKGALPPKAE